MLATSELSLIVVAVSFAAIAAATITPDPEDGNGIDEGALRSLEAKIEGLGRYLQYQDTLVLGLEGSVNDMTDHLDQLRESHLNLTERIQHLQGVAESRFNQLAESLHTTSIKHLQVMLLMFFLTNSQHLNQTRQLLQQQQQQQSPASRQPPVPPVITSDSLQ